MWVLGKEREGEEGAIFCLFKGSNLRCPSKLRVDGLCLNVILMVNSSWLIHGNRFVAAAHSLLISVP